MSVELKPGMLVVTEGGNDFIARAVKWFTRSRWTHTFFVLTPLSGMEAWYPDGVRLFDLPARLAELEREGRDYVILDHPAHTPYTRQAVFLKALHFLGRKYDILQIVYFALFRRFIDDGPLRVICSRLETAVYQEALGWQLFTEESFAAHRTKDSRRAQLERGWATPGEMLEDSVLDPVSSRTSTDLHGDYQDEYDNPETYTVAAQLHMEATSGQFETP